MIIARILCCLAICFDGDIRFAAGTGNGVTSGRLEVCVNEVWGTVCDDFWTAVDSNVACGQLGFSRFSTSAVCDESYIVSLSLL